MPKVLRKTSATAGLPPGVPVYVGERQVEQVVLTVIEYDEGHFQRRQAGTVEECFPFKPAPLMTWLNVDGLHEVETMEAVGARLGLHPLVVEDILNTDQRPKMEDYDDYIYVVVKMLERGEDNDIRIDQMSMVFGPNWLVTFQELPGDVFDPVRERLGAGKGRLRKMGVDYLAYALLDAVVDNYFVLLEDLGEDVETLQERLVAEPASTPVMRDIHRLKSEMIFMRRAVWPLRETVNGMQRSDSDLMCDATRVYLQDLYDHVIQVIDAIETFRDMLSGMLDMYLSSVSNQLNSVMKVLTIIGTIFIPLTFITGVYGMNFDYMPELRWHWGYPTVWIVMVAIAIGMLIMFKRRKWM